MSDEKRGSTEILLDELESAKRIIEEYRANEIKLLSRNTKLTEQLSNSELKDLGEGTYFLRHSLYCDVIQEAPKGPYTRISFYLDGNIMMPEKFLKIHTDSEGKRVAVFVIEELP